ncbi:MAG: hypothetical protein RXR70_04825 [Acidilobus sp.]
MLSMEETLYISLAAGVLIGVVLSTRRVNNVKAVDVTSTISIIALVLSMGLVVGSEVLSLGGLVFTVIAASIAIAVLPGLLGSYLAEVEVRRSEGGAKGSS